MAEQGDRSQDIHSQPQDVGKFDAARHMAEQRIDEAIDQYVKKIPGAEKFAAQAKKASSGILENIEKQAEGRFGGIKSSASGILGGIFGRNKPKEPPAQ